MIPCDICSKQGHVWFECPKRSTMPANWKPARLTKSALAVKPAPRPAKPTAPAQADTAREGQAKRPPKRVDGSILPKAQRERRGVASDLPPATKSTAARMDVQPDAAPTRAEIAHRLRAGDSAQGRHLPRSVQESPAGTQAPPVDTLKAAEVAAAHLAPKRKRGRPPNGFDKKAHDRRKAAERRAKLKEQK